MMAINDLLEVSFILFKMLYDCWIFQMRIKTWISGDSVHGLMVHLQFLFRDGELKPLIQFHFQVSCQKVMNACTSVIKLPLYESIHGSFCQNICLCKDELDPTCTDHCPYCRVKGQLYMEVPKQDQ